MIIKVLEVFTEYIGIMLCIHKTAGKKVKVNWNSLLDIACYMTIAFVVENISWGRLAIYTYLFVYIRMRIVDTWKHAVKPFVVMMCTIPTLQLLIYAAISEKMQEVFDIYFIVIAINILIIFIFLMWKQR
ncbi:MAG: hypothetical protein K2N90_04510, partial [Lachnospiraceae bacterium]|nr:hypothetical protein [Lachnospiraceae bacterium]